MMFKSPNNLLFSFDKEFENPNSKAGKVWQIFIRNGNLHLGDCIQITSVRLEGQPKSELFTIDAIVKSIHEEFDIAVEGVKELDVVSRGNIVGIDIKNCHSKRKKINKKEMTITKQSIGFFYNESFEYHNKFYIKFINAEKAFDVIDVGKSIVLIWYGKRMSAKVTKISESLEGMFIELEDNNRIAIPIDPVFRNSEIIKKIVISVLHKGKHNYISGLFEF